MTTDRNAAPHAAMRLFGEPREGPAPRIISAGRLSFTLDGMALRWIRYDGIELLRGTAFVVRDRDWGTYEPAVTIEAEEHGAVRAMLRLSARITQGRATLECRMIVTANAEGLSVAATAAACGLFHTNRTGFVVLHPAWCAGRAIRVEHADGSAESGQFPALVSPHQPFFEIAAIEHEPAPGLSARISFSGEVFEMEDQRNWSDASFKTYSRPLARPYPYTIEDGETVSQTVRLSISGQRAAERGPRQSRRIEVTEEQTGRLPRLGIGGRPGDYNGSAVCLARLASLKPALLLGELGAELPDAAALQAYRSALAATSASAAIMLRAHPTGALAALDRLAQAGIEPAEVALVTTDRAVLKRLRRALPRARIGTGTDAFFAEFNRVPPPTADFAFWTVTPTVHATDDASVMETLSVLSDQVTTARARYPDTALWCGPITLRMRFNPNATAPPAPLPPGMPSPEFDARQRGLFAACFALGQIAAWSRAGLETLILHAPFGPCGLIHAPSGLAEPWYDAQPDGVVYPVYQVLAGLAGQSEAALYRVHNPMPEQVVALATGDALWLANTGPTPIEITVPGSGARVMDAERFAEATGHPEGFWGRDIEPFRSGLLPLGAYAVARISLP